MRSERELRNEHTVTVVLVFLWMWLIMFSLATVVPFVVCSCIDYAYDLSFDVSWGLWRVYAVYMFFATLGVCVYAQIKSNKPVKAKILDETQKQ